MISEEQLKAWAEVEDYMHKEHMKFSNTRIDNPAVTFTNQAKAGKFNDLSDAEYEEALSIVKSQSRMWCDRPYLTADTLAAFVAHFLPSEEAVPALVEIAKKVIDDNKSVSLHGVGLFDTPWDKLAEKYSAERAAMSMPYVDRRSCTIPVYNLAHKNVEFGPLTFDCDFWNKFEEFICRTTGASRLDDNFTDVMEQAAVTAIEAYMKQLDEAVSKFEKKSKKGKGDKK